MEDLIEDNSERPNIDSVRIIMKLGLFRRNVLFSTCNGLHNDFLSAKPKIR